MGNPAVEMKNVQVRYGPETGIDIPELVIPAGARVALVGPSGSGKTTLAAAIGGFLPAEATVHIGGADGSSNGADGVFNVAGKVGYVAQDSFAALNPLMRVEKQVALVGDPAVLRRVGLSEQQAKSYPLALSGGQRQRATIAFALAGKPALIIADEITSALDPVAIIEILDALDAAAKDATVIFISHNEDAANYFCDMRITMTAVSQTPGTKACSADSAGGADSADSADSAGGAASAGNADGAGGRGTSGIYQAVVTAQTKVGQR